MGNHYEIYRKSGKFMPIPSKTESIQTLSVKDRIYNVVCEWIITGVLKSGEKILDSELAQYFDVSRTPVREAIQMLERQKLVKVIPSRGTIVANIERSRHLQQRKHVNGSVRNSCFQGIQGFMRSL